MDHASTIFEDQSGGLRTHYTGLHRPPPGDAYRFITGRFAMPARWDLLSFDHSSTGQHQPISQTLHLIPRLWIYLDTRSYFLGDSGYQLYDSPSSPSMLAESTRAKAEEARRTGYSSSAMIASSRTAKLALPSPYRKTLGHFSYIMTDALLGFPAMPISSPVVGFVATKSLGSSLTSSVAPTPLRHSSLYDPVSLHDVNLVCHDFFHLNAQRLKSRNCRPAKLLLMPE